MYPIRCRCGTMRQTYQDPRCRWCGGCRRGLEYPWGNVAIPEIMRGLVAVPVGGGRAWPGFETTRRAKLAARTASGRATARRHAKQPGPTARPHGKVRRCPEHQQRRKQRCGRATARRHAKQPGPTARCDGARSTRGTTHHRRQSARIPSQQRRQVDAPAARELGCLGAAREAVRQIHRVRLSIKRGQQRMRCDRD